MKLVKGNSQPSFRDKLPDGKRFYTCPCCIGKGKKIAAGSVTVTYTSPMEEGNRILPGQIKDPEMKCPECGETVAVLKNGKWLKMDLI